MRASQRSERLEMTPQYQGCFQNVVAQAIHKYANMVLVLLLAALAWWLVGVDRRITVNSDINQKHAAEIQGLKERSEQRSEALMRRIDEIDKKLAIIDNRLYLLFSPRKSGEPFP